jgi:pilus assembly protein CpaB
MDRRLLTLLGGSLVFALVISGIFYQMTSRSGGEAKKPEISELKDLVIAARPLPPGLTIKAADIKVVKTPAATFPKGAYSKPEDVLDRSLNSNVLIDEAILDGRLAPRGAGPGLPAMIPVGMRAVTVRVNDVVGVAGFVLPGMRVDVLITGEPPGAESRMTKTVLQNMLVLSAGQTTQIDATGKPVNAPNVTLLAKLAEAESLTLAGNEGRIQLVLRNAADEAVESTGGQTLHNLYGVARPAKPAEEAPAPPRPRPRPRPVPAVASAAPPLIFTPVPTTETIVMIRGVEKKEATVNVPAKPADENGRTQ